MLETTAYKQISQLNNFLAKKPDLRMVLEFISGSMSPDLEICGVTFAVVDEDRNIHAPMRFGFNQNLPPIPNFTLDSNYPIAIALRSQEIMYEDLIGFDSYFNCLRTALVMYLKLQDKKFINDFELTNKLTKRQEKILRLIQNGLSNRAIATELAYSISLIRQETMRIYAKLNVSGRQELKKLSQEV